MIWSRNDDTCLKSQNSVIEHSDPSVENYTEKAKTANTKQGMT